MMVSLSFQMGCEPEAGCCPLDNGLPTAIKPPTPTRRILPPPSALDRALERWRRSGYQDEEARSEARRIMALTRGTHSVADAMAGIGQY